VSGCFELATFAVKMFTILGLRHQMQVTFMLFIIYGWRRGVVVSGVRRMNEVNARRARLVPGWVTVFGRVYHHHHHHFFIRSK